jgi:hypothetical protein
MPVSKHETGSLAGGGGQSVSQSPWLRSILPGPPDLLISSPAFEQQRTDLLIPSLILRHLQGVIFAKKKKTKQKKHTKINEVRRRIQ